MADNPSRQEASSPPAATKSGGATGKLVIAGFMSSVVLIECGLFYFMTPTAEQIAALAEENLQKKLPASLGTGTDEGSSKSGKPTVEIDLGEYSVTVNRATSPTVIRVDFHLVGTAEEADLAEVKSALDRNMHRFRDMVISEIRNLDNADFVDPGLGLIKRRILEKSNHLFGKPILNSVVFPDFSYFEQ